MSKGALRDTLKCLLDLEASQHGELEQPDYRVLHELSLNWREVAEDLLEAGGGSSLVCAVAASIRDQDATGALAEFALCREGDLLLRSALVIALGRTGGDGAEKALMAALDQDPALRRIAARELALMGTPGSAVSLSIRLGSPDLATRRDIAAGLAWRGDRDAVEILLEAVGQHGDRVAAEVLGQLAVPSAVPELLALLCDPDPDCRETALVALARIGDPRALPMVLGCLADEAGGVRSGALDCVETITGVRPFGLLRLPQGHSFTRATREWWADARSVLAYRCAYLHGRQRSLEVWIDALSVLPRKTLDPARADAVHARLAVASGVDLGYDAYDLDPERRESALRAWRGWWRLHQKEFPAGGWYRHGRRIAVERRWGDG